MVEFGQMLPQIREQVEKDLSLSGLPQRKVLAIIICFIKTTFIRIGKNRKRGRRKVSYQRGKISDENYEKHGIQSTRKIFGIVSECFLQTKTKDMLRLAILFFIVAVVSAVLGFGGVAVGAAVVAKALFYICVALFIFSMLGHMMRQKA